MRSGLRTGEGSVSEGQVEAKRNAGYLVIFDVTADRLRKIAGGPAKCFRFFLVNSSRKYDKINQNISTFVTSFTVTISC